MEDHIRGAEDSKGTVDRAPSPMGQGNRLREARQAPVTGFLTQIRRTLELANYKAAPLMALCRRLYRLVAAVGAEASPRVVGVLVAESLVVVDLSCRRLRAVWAAEFLAAVVCRRV
ncbi:hypothetical protein [Mycobacterium sp. 1465703.0]|uniref:hypothetical protein n=1 Tax=Mycobacterium sp. 1465703.0 TaxID=1834078 RepID=UPI0007FC0028|nr:hypothetical protein [Mycobacterium sp. 1465703.0]OBJ10861.1 hypothetical protein A5625_10345 [Mycobacterium sp. 1465703.0]